MLALLAPPRCSGCAAPCARECWICRDCRARLVQLRLGSEAGPVRAAFAYEGVARRLVAALKFEGAVALAGELAEELLAAMPAAVGPSDAIVPAPAHPLHLRKRGYNQAALLAEAIADRTGAEVVDCLTRRRGGRPQSEQGRAGRLAMPSGAIVLDGARLEAADKTNVVVCDDVTTTGVTLEICAQAIRDQLPGGGSASIRGVVFARSLGRGWATRPGKTDRKAGAVAPKADSLDEPPPAVRSTSVNRSN